MLQLRAAWALRWPIALAIALAGAGVQTWRLDRAHATLAEESGQSLDDLSGELGFDPSDIAESLLATEGAVEIGAETIDGVDTRRYEVTVDVASAIAALPQADLDDVLGDLEVPDVDVPDTLVYDVWVTGDNELRRAVFDVEIAGQTVVGKKMERPVLEHKKSFEQRGQWAEFIS